jgi:hypothetical protein
MDMVQTLGVLVAHRNCVEAEIAKIKDDIEGLEQMCSRYGGARHCRAVDSVNALKSLQLHRENTLDNIDRQLALVRVQMEGAETLVKRLNRTRREVKVPALSEAMSIRAESSILAATHQPIDDDEIAEEMQ